MHKNHLCHVWRRHIADVTPHTSIPRTNPGISSCPPVRGQSARNHRVWTGRDECTAGHHRVREVAVGGVRGEEGADAVVSAATRLRLLDEADELVAEMRGECARRVAALALVVVSHLRAAQSGEGFVGGENLGSSVAARAGETRAAVDGALRELEGYAKDAAEAMRAATADVDAALGAPVPEIVTGPEGQIAAAITAEVQRIRRER